MKETIFANKLSLTSIALSILSIVLIVNTNHDIALRYLEADGKTRALFGITETLCFGYQYYWGLISLAALAFAIIASIQHNRKIINRLAYAFTALSLLLLFSRIWRLMV